MTTKKKAKSKSKKQTFEDDLERLEVIVEKLEGGELDLDESLELFEEGVNLSRACMKKLEEAQTKVELLLKDPEGEVRRQALEVDGMGEDSD